MILKEAAQHHWDGSLRDSDSPRLVQGMHVLAPVIFGMVAFASHGVWGYQLDLTACVSILTGLLFSLLAFLVQLRYDVRKRSNTEDQTRDRDVRNIDYAFQSSVYAIMVGIGNVTLLVVQKLLQRHIEQVPHLPVGSNWLVYALFAHFILTVWMVLRRLWRLYNVFGLNQS